MKILTINNKKEEKFLRQKTAEFDFSLFNKKKDISNLIALMEDIMIKSNGVGLSANQIGINAQIFVARLPEIEGEKIVNWNFYAVFNPQIKEFFKEKNIDEEGCLSIPKIYSAVERFNKVIIIGQDKNGKKIKIKADGLLARIFQHEIDHLNGILFIDKAKNLHKAEINKNL